MALGILDKLGIEVIAGLIVTAVLGLAGFAAKRWLLPVYREWREARLMRETEPFFREYLSLSLSYQTHLHDVMQTFRRARDDAHWGEVRERIRREVLEPIRGFVPTITGEQIKVVWFRPDAAGASLVAYEQVGYPSDTQSSLTLPIGGGLAGRCFSTGRPQSADDCSTDPSFLPVAGGDTAGSCVCAPIIRGERVLGVLSVLSTCQDAFWITERSYFEVLGSAIAALEPLQEPDESADETAADPNV